MCPHRRSLRRFLPALCLLLAGAVPAVAEAPRKVLAEPGLIDARPGVTLLHDYGSFALYRMSEATLEALPPSLRQRIVARGDHDRLLFDAAPFDTQRGRPSVPAAWAATEALGTALQVVQFVGPVKAEWLEALRAAGAEPVHYVANHGYLVWADAAGRAQLAALALSGDVVQHSGPFHPYFKLGHTLRARFDEKGADPAEVVRVAIQVYRHPEREETVELIRARALEQLSPWQEILAFQNVIVTLRLGDLAEIAARGDVTWIGERLERELYDEVQGQILGANFDGGMTGPSAPGYLAFLATYGFSTTPADYPVIDITDDGIGNGAVSSGDPTLHELGDDANPSRLVYVANCTNAANGGGPDGHGHLNVNIAGGYDLRSGFPFQDPDSYQRGLGINPYARLAGTRVFAPGFSLATCGGTDTGLIKAEQDAGAQISSNSWGCSGCAGSYDDSSQAFDVGVRDADLTEAGNQELIFLFAAGNSGPGSGTVGSPGNGKNMITVGASENDRPSDEDGSWNDGCFIGPTGADNAMDVIGFSSRGPSPGGRAKPEVIAPGTHVQGTASSHPSYNGSGVCDTFRPSGQTTFAASSGTSHSTPAVAGLASLVYNWIENGNAGPLGIGVSSVSPTPSPALMKAYLMAHPTYLTGVSANDDLPSNSQGYGMPNMQLLFDDAQKFLLNQTEVLDDSGATWTWVGAVADTGRPVRIALAYTDEAGAMGTSPQVNDLDLEAEVDGTTYLGNDFSGQWSTTGGSPDALNNYEAIFLPAGTGGAISITVRATNVAGDGVPNSGDDTDQDFALVCYNCAQEPTFTLSGTPGNQEICAPADAVYTLDVGSVLGFSDPVTLAVSGEPAGTATGFSVNPVAPGGSSDLTVSNTGAATASHYDLTVTGTSGATVRNRGLGLDLFTGLPGTVTLLTPADGAIDQPAAPTLTWSEAASGGGGTYTVEIATDDAFTAIVDSATGLASATFTPANLDTNTVHYWRVRATNVCGTDADSATFSFTTEPAPGDCPLGVTAVRAYETDFESGTAGWTTGGSSSTWTISSARTHSGVAAFHAEDIPDLSDQYLVSPPVVLPSFASPLTLQFWNHQTIEDRTGGCYDGAVVEISTDGGSIWTRLEAELLTDPYDGPVSTGFSSALAGENAWCGDPQDWLESVVDLDAWAGQTVQFRFRLATDTIVGREGWYVDDVVVQSCPDPATFIFSDGFESGNLSAWSSSVP